jgi:enoyl-CoA hydratase
MNKHDRVLCERRDSLALVIINRENELNTLDLTTIRELARIFTELQNDPDVRVIILTGAGERAFSVGADLDAMSAVTSEQAKEYAREGQALTVLIEDLGKPVIGAINGLAAGGGFELAMACTWRIATANSSFSQPEARLGLMPGFGGTTRLPKLIGKSRALEMILTGEPLTAQEAMLIGLVNLVVPDDSELMTICLKLALRISRNAPLAIKYAIEAVNHGAEVTMAEGLRLESALFGLCLTTEDVKEGTRAFLEKRHPVFKGR